MNQRFKWERKQILEENVGMKLYRPAGVGTMHTWNSILNHGVSIVKGGTKCKTFNKILWFGFEHIRQRKI